LREHGRQAHKVAFNPADGRLLLSASQDGTIKLWDLRERKSRLTFVGRADAVRDVQFNPVNVIEFAAAFDNGTIQVVACPSFGWEGREEMMGGLIS
jgi:WD40 repeat protein